MPRSSGGQVLCQYCTKSLTRRGLGAHEKSCKERTIAKRLDAEYRRNRSKEKGKGKSSGSGGDTHAGFDIPLSEGLSVVMEDVWNSVPGFETHDKEDSPVPDFVPLLPGEPIPQPDDIKIEYHPNSNRPTEIHHFAEYGRTKTPLDRQDSCLDREPWRPFRSRIDFDFAEFALGAALNREQTDTLIRLVHHVQQKQDTFTLASHAELTKTWKEASIASIPFEQISLSVPYKGEDRTFEIWRRSLFDWALQLLSKRDIVEQWEFDAQRLYKFDSSSQTWVRFFTEPQTGNTWWKIQSKLPKEGKPLCIILYADKTKLSSFGTAKGYPVVARIAGLPADIRNGNGIAGGRVVGWLPVINEEAGETGKTGYVNFKKVVWHESFAKILETIAVYSKSGYWFQCGDDIQRHLYFLILILSADYEEQCIMALTRGTGSLYPCPICLVPKGQLINLEQMHRLRTTASMKMVVNNAIQASTKAEGEEILKNHGLRGIINAFWAVENSDPYAALSWDRLHAYHGGLFSDHIWPEILELVATQGKRTSQLVDNQTDMIPRWRNLNHFSSITTTSFTDGSKYEDISKIALFVLHNILVDSRGFLLLQCLRSYLELDMYASLEVHTTHTLADGRAELKNFSNLMKKYVDEYGEKEWDFPKLHTHQHLFDDIENKGVTRNYNTKPNEKMHGPLKTAYKLRTNFKNVAGQILWADHCSLVSAFMRDLIDELDMQDNHSEDESETLDSELQPSLHIVLGAAQPQPLSCQAVQECYSMDAAFQNFGKKLGQFFSNYLGHRIQFQPTDLIIEYRFLKVSYESKVNWELVTDYLRCNPCFHNNPRYDCVVVEVSGGLGQPSGYIFAQLCFVFSCNVGNKKYPMALIQPYDALPGTVHRRRDKLLHLHRVRSKPRGSSEFISVESIIRGALLVQAYGSSGEFLVVDVIDGDMWLRMKEIRSV